MLTEFSSITFFHSLTVNKALILGGIGSKVLFNYKCHFKDDSMVKFSEIQTCELLNLLICVQGTQYESEGQEELKKINIKQYAFRSY